LRASKAYWSGQNEEQDLQAAITAYSEAIRLDQDYALAYADRAHALTELGDVVTDPTHLSDYYRRAEADARKATTLAPELAEGHLALARLAFQSLEFTGASNEYERALALAPGKARVLSDYGEFAILMGRTETRLAAAQRSMTLDPLNSLTHYALGLTLLFARRNSEAVVALTDAKSLDLNDAWFNAWLGQAYYASGKFESARAACEGHGDQANNHICLAIVYDKLGRHADAEAMLADAQTSWGDSGAVQYAEVYAQWSQTGRALSWLETAMRHHDPYLRFVKTDPLFDPLRNEPRFQAIERALKFPEKRD
jgi:serine/threonine-protein kinase